MTAMLRKTSEMFVLPSTGRPRDEFARPVLADNNHSATVNGIAVVNVRFTGSATGTGKLTVPITQCISSFATTELE